MILTNDIQYLFFYGFKLFIKYEYTHMYINIDIKVITTAKSNKTLLTQVSFIDLTSEI